MNISIIIIGDEILLGRVTDTNSGLIARRFSELGWQVKSVRTVGDDRHAICEAVVASLEESDLVISTGGLGPTRDDITKFALMDIFGGALYHNDEVATNVDRIFCERGLAMNELTRRQALVPDTCRVIQNTLGTAPIMWFGKDGKVLITMPGVPFETRGMLETIVAEVEKHFGSVGRTMHREFTATGITESGLAEHLAAYEDCMPEGYKLAYLPSPGEIVLRLDGKPDDTADNFEAEAARLTAALGKYLAGSGKLSPAQMVLHKVRAHGYTLATAESCTGGNIAHLITQIAGCSDVFRGGVVSYANEVKTGVLGVDPAILESDGAVSQATVRQMTAGACRACGADCSVATSGIAGPGGAVPGKPVGTVWIAARTPHASVEREYHFSGDRQAVIDRASATALMLLASLL